MIPKEDLLQKTRTFSKVILRLIDQLGCYLPSSDYWLKLLLRRFFEVSFGTLISVLNTGCKNYKTYEDAMFFARYFFSDDVYPIEWSFVYQALKIDEIYAEKIAIFFMEVYNYLSGAYPVYHEKFLSKLNKLQKEAYNVSRVHKSKANNRGRNNCKKKTDLHPHVSGYGQSDVQIFASANKS